MPKSNKTSSHKKANNPSQDEASAHEESSSEQENNQDVTFNQAHVQQVIPSMFMPYIQGTKMDWTVNDGLYHRFLKWRLKCKNILECDLAMLLERRKCKKVVGWSGDFGIEQYLLWNLTNAELTLDVIWKKCEKFCQLQCNEVRARFDLFTSFRQGERSVNGWCNTVQTQVALVKYPQVSCKNSM